MGKRILTAAIGIPILGVAIYFSDTIVYPIIMGVLALLGVFEMLGCIGMRRNVVVSASMYLLTVCTFVFSQLIGTPLIKSPSIFLSVYISFMFVVLFILLVLAVFSKGKIPVDKVCVAFVTCSYVVAGFISMVLIKGVSDNYGMFLIIMCFMIPWVSDTFAYFGGMLFGKHKLIPSVSPKKTVEGSICGIVFATIASFFYGFLAKELFPLWVFAILGFLVAIGAQIGDLIFSLIKRRYDVKDFGFIFPGHGGLLDRFDSVIATTPLLLILCVFYNAMNALGII